MGAGGLHFNYGSLVKFVETTIFGSSGQELLETHGAKVEGLNHPGYRLSQWTYHISPILEQQARNPMSPHFTCIVLNRLMAAASSMPRKLTRSPMGHSERQSIPSCSTSAITPAITSGRVVRIDMWQFWA